METLKDLDLVRAISPRPELIRSESDDTREMPTMVVEFSKFNTWYEINSYFEGNFLERTVAGAFKKTIRENRDNIKVLYDHGHDYHIGNKVLGPIKTLREDPVTGPVAEVQLLDTSYNRDLLPGLEAGVYGSSFRFRVVKEEWNEDPGRSDHNPDGIPERTIKEVRLYEFGPVTFPANPDSTAGVRGLTDDYYGRVRMRNPEMVEDLVARAKQLHLPERITVNTKNQETDDADVLDTEENSTSGVASTTNQYVVTTHTLKPESVLTAEQTEALREAANNEQEAAERTSEDEQEAAQDEGTSERSDEDERTSDEEAAEDKTVEPPSRLHSPMPKSLRRARLAWINGVLDGQRKRMRDYYDDEE